MNTRSAALLAAASATFFNNALQWYTQVSIYPLFAALPEDGFVAYHKAYERRLPWSIYLPYGALMGATALLLAHRPDRVEAAWVATALALNGSIMATSLALAVPLHTRLDRDGKSNAGVRRLVRVNALRLGAATASSAIMLGLLGRQLAAASANENDA